jgi:hypothetical protein
MFTATLKSYFLQCYLVIVNAFWVGVTLNNIGGLTELCFLNKYLVYRYIPLKKNCLPEFSNIGRIFFIFPPTPHHFVCLK